MGNIDCESASSRGWLTHAAGVAGVFTVHCKNMGKDTWTGKLRDIEVCVVALVVFLAVPVLHCQSAFACCPRDGYNSDRGILVGVEGPKMTK